MYVIEEEAEQWQVGNVRVVRPVMQKREFEYENNEGEVETGEDDMYNVFHYSRFAEGDLRPYDKVAHPVSVPWHIWTGEGDIPSLRDAILDDESGWSMLKPQRDIVNPSSLPDSCQALLYEE